MKRNLCVEALESRRLLTGEPIDTLDRRAVVAAYADQFKPYIDVPVEWNGSVAGCVAGSGSQAATTATLNVLNFLRNMSGLQGVEWNPIFSEKAQQAALMMQAQNALSHTPHTNWACYSEAGAQGAGASNLYLGVTGPKAMVGYVEDPGSGNYAVGHRRWLLNPHVEQMGIGSTSNANALYVFGPRVNRPAPDWTSWPPQGYVPKELIFPRWSLSRAGADFGDATVRMSVYGESVPVDIQPIVAGFGLNTLVWEPSLSLDMVSAEEFTVDVFVENVKLNGVATSFQYSVTPIHPGPTVQTVVAAQDDRFEMRAGQANFYFNVLANDDLTLGEWAPATNASLRAEVVDDPEHGYLLRAIGSPGILFYFPDPGFVGVDTFSYRIADLDAGRVSNLAHVQIRVGEPPGNRSPTISGIQHIVAAAGVATESVPFTIGDLETNANNLTVAITSANRTLLPLESIQLSGSGAERALTITPAAGQAGADTITVWVSDGQNTSFESFVVTVPKVYDPPISRVLPFQGPVESRFIVEWSSQQGSNLLEVAYHDIYVSINGGAYQLWLGETRQASAEYMGQPGASYSFYSVATDTAGQREQKAPLAEATTRVVGNSAWRNASNPSDVNADRMVTPLDILTIVNYLNSGQPRYLPDSNVASLPYLDVSGDEWVTPVDILLVVNYLNGLRNGNGEGESPAPSDPLSDFQQQAWQQQLIDDEEDEEQLLRSLAEFHLSID